MDENMKIIVWMERNLCSIERAFTKNARRTLQNSRKIRTLSYACALGFGFLVAGMSDKQAQINELKACLNNFDGGIKGESVNEEEN